MRLYQASFVDSIWICFSTRNKVGLSGFNNRKHIAHMKEDEIHLVYYVNELPSFELFPFLGIGLEGEIVLLT